MPPSVVETEFGRLGGLICWENYMPLARMALYQQGIDLYVAPTADNRESWQATIRHIACEGRCFVLACNQFIEKKIIRPNCNAGLNSKLSPNHSAVVAAPSSIRQANIWPGLCGIKKIFCWLNWIWNCW